MVHQFPITPEVCLDFCKNVCGARISSLENGSDHQIGTLWRTSFSGTRRRRVGALVPHGILAGSLVAFELAFRVTAIMKFGVDAGDDPFPSGVAQDSSVQEGLHNKFALLWNSACCMMTSCFSSTEVGTFVMKVPSTTSGTIIVTSLAFFGIEAEKVSGSMALSVSNGDASFVIGASDHAVAWTEVQIEPWQVGVTSAEETEFGCSVSCSASRSKRTDFSVQNLQSVRAPYSLVLALAKATRRSGESDHGRE